MIMPAIQPARPPMMTSAKKPMGCELPMKAKGWSMRLSWTQWRKGYYANAAGFVPEVDAAHLMATDAGAGGGGAKGSPR